MLLIVHLSLLVIFLLLKWTSIRSFLADVRLIPFTSEKQKLDPYTVTTILFTCNLIGITFARGMHQQFYAWYQFSIPFLLEACTALPPLIKILVYFILDVSWSLGPPRFALQSLCIFLSHLLIIICLLSKEKMPIYHKESIQKSSKVE